ncbi:MAG TPA: phytoene/squalene synthase family protein [Pirellulales bacterium]|jgi:phytoene synthase|nr:phytoene/squalene synthase family protein [Pirellulales bacterium]
MNELAASYVECQRVARRSASSFYYSFLLLPKRKRRAMCVLYAFLRRTDDLGDNSDSVSERRAALQSWRHSLARAARGIYDDPLLPAVADVIEEFSVPPEYLTSVIDGVEMDLEPCRYETFEQLEKYCYRVASVVGLACLRIWGCAHTDAQRPARQCGLAFQMTNILRDLNEDVARDRIYFPQQDLDRFGYTADELRAGAGNDRFRELMRFEIERTEKFYAEAADLEQWLEPDGRRVFGSMMAVYRALLAEIKRLDGDVLSRRVRLSRWHKMRIATRWLLVRSAAATAGIHSP